MSIVERLKEYLINESIDLKKYNIEVIFEDEDEVSDKDIKKIESGIEYLISIFKSSGIKKASDIVDTVIQNGDYYIFRLNITPFIDFVVDESRCKEFIKYFKRFELDKDKDRVKFKIKLDDIK